MSSPDVKIQSLLRKYKNGIKEIIDRKIIIHNYSYEINNENILTSMYLSSKKCIIKSDDTDIEKLSINITETDKNINIYEYIGGSESIYSNVYNAEYCDEEWVAFMFFINRIYMNFNNNDKFKINSLFITDYSNISSMHHFIYNSNIKLNNLDWEWMLTVFSHKKNPLKKKYNKNILKLQDINLHSINNINYIINEIVSSFSKINFIINTQVSYNNFIACAALSIKLLDNNCIFYTKLPDFYSMDDSIIEILLLYSLIFEELYIYKLDLIKPRIYLLCKNKKKLNTENLYKKLISCMNTSSIFSKDFILETNKIWYEKINNIIKSENDGSSNISSIKFDDINNEINEILCYNYDSLL